MRKKIIAAICSTFILGICLTNTAFGDSPSSRGSMQVKPVEMNSKYDSSINNSFASRGNELSFNNDTFNYQLSESNGNMSLTGELPFGNSNLKLNVSGELSIMELTNGKVLNWGDLEGFARSSDKSYNAVLGYNECGGKTFFTLSLFDPETQKSSFFDLGTPFTDRLEQVDMGHAVQDNKKFNINKFFSFSSSSSSFEPYQLAATGNSLNQTLKMYRYPSQGVPQMLQTITTKSSSVKYRYSYWNYGKMDVIPIKTKLHTENVPNNGLHELHFIHIAPDKIEEASANVVVKKVGEFISKIPVAGQIYDAIVEFADEFKSTIAVKNNISLDKSFDWEYNLKDIFYTYQSGDYIKDLKNFPIYSTLYINPTGKNTLKSDLTIEFNVICYPKTGNILVPVNRYRWTEKTSAQFNYTK